MCCCALAQQHCGRAAALAAVLPASSSAVAPSRLREASAFGSQRGWWITAPSARVAKDARPKPRSMPVCWPLSGSRRTGTSAQEMATYQPAASCVIVTGLGTPSTGRDQCTSLHPQTPDRGQDQDALVTGGPV